MAASQKIFWIATITLMLAVISGLHYTTSTMRWQYHLIYMESYFIPILIAAFQFGVKGGLSTSVAISLIYFPHVMLQWGGLVETNLMRFIQIALFNIIGYLTGLKAQAEKEEKLRYQHTAEELRESLQLLKKQSETLSEFEEQLRLADRLAVVGELTASLAHEVRNPLGAIRGAAEILQEELPEEHRKSEFFQILIEETGRLSEVLENYLSFTRRQKHRLSEFNFAEVVQSAIQLLGYGARKSHIHCDLQLPEEPILLHGDPNHLRQILVNLMLNSIQAMPNGGRISISAEILDQKQAETASPNSPPHRLLVTIRDQGVGIEAEKLKDIFKPFYTTKSNGSGLGLAIVKRLAEANHWKIDVCSEPGKGTDFYLTLPMV